MKTFFTLILLLFIHFTFCQVFNRDYDFNTNHSTSGLGDVRSLTVQNDKQIVIVGNYYTYNGTPSWFINRLNSDGSNDTSFHTPSLDWYPNAVAVQPWDNKIIIGGDFHTVNGLSREGIARLNTNGSLDTSFDPGTGLGRTPPLPDGTPGGREVYKIIIKDDPDPNTRRILVGGRFSTYNGDSTGRWGGVVQLNTNGSRDASFDPQISTTGHSTGGVYDMCLDRYGRLVIVGECWQGGTNPIRYCDRIAIINPDGTLDPTFFEDYEFFTGPNGTVTCLALDDYDNILIGGTFTKVDGITCNGMARLKRTVMGYGLLDTAFSFNMGAGLQGGLHDNHANGGTEAKGFYIMPGTNTIIVVGNFSSFNGTPCNNIVSVNVDGTVGPYSFGTGINDAGIQIARQNLGNSDDRIIIGGFFNSYSGQTQGSVIRLVPGPPPGPLPVDLTYAAASIRNNDVALYWKMAMPQPTDRFQIMKSTDGRNFNVIREMNEPNTLREGDEYTYVDKNVTGQHIHYIIKVIHADGKTSVSRTLSVDIKNSNFKVQAYSDPASHTIHISTQTDKPVNEDVNIFTGSGQLMKKTTLSVGAGNSESILDGGFIGSGRYIVLSIQVKETGQIFSYTLAQ